MDYLNEVEARLRLRLSKAGLGHMGRIKEGKKYVSLINSWTRLDRIGGSKN